MNKLSTYLVVTFSIIFWIFRIILTLSAQLGKNFMGLVPFNMTFEIILLFAFLLCLILIIKRKTLGALIYLALYGIYFGGDITNKIMLISQGEKLGTTGLAELFFSIIGIILPIMTLLDLLFDKGRKEHPVDKKTDWFYKNEKFDREIDEKADKNNYRTM